MRERVVECVYSEVVGDRVFCVVYVFLRVGIFFVGVRGLFFFVRV